MQQRPSNSLNGFGRYLLSKGLLTAKDLQDIAHAVNSLSTPRETLIYTLATKHYLSSEQLADYASEYFRLPRHYLSDADFDLIPKNKLTLAVMKKYYIVPLQLKDQQLIVVTSDPTEIDLQEINFCLGHQCQLFIVAHDKLSQLIERIERVHFEEAFQIRFNSTSENSVPININEFQSEHSAVVIFLNKIFEAAINKNASDIHFEPYDTFFRIRFRIDGVLHEESRPPHRLSRYIAARLKILAALDIAERRGPQDGRFSILVNGATRDVRLSTCPTNFGEKCVLRLLDTSSNLLGLNELGMQPEQFALLKQSIIQPQGFILVTGPTGSGKTTTLYAILAELNDNSRNILAIEDPIEIPLPGINQIQVNLKSRMSFGDVLRACLRQDPDVIFVGEIRDQLTAELAIAAAHTGHLVLSTLHTNTAQETIKRLSNLGISAYNLESALKLTISQRLLRKLCDHCKKPMNLSDNNTDYLQEFTAKFSASIYTPYGCLRCNDGFKGRIGIFETVIPTGLSKDSDVANNMSSVGLQQVKEGQTSLCELQRVLGHL